ncbi:hypothetical protein V5799_022285, partial [Amblyomma americanum]
MILFMPALALPAVGACVRQGVIFSGIFMLHQAFVNAPASLANVHGTAREGDLVNQRHYGKSKRDACQVRHVSPSIPCEVGVVYQVPFSCGAMYIGQTG